MDGFEKLISEIHRRSLWQVLGIYLAGSWVALQVVETVVEAASLPEWLPGMALVLLVIGLPVVRGTAFVQEGGPGTTVAPTFPDEVASGEQTKAFLTIDPDFDALRDHPGYQALLVGP